MGIVVGLATGLPSPVYGSPVPPETHPGSWTLTTSAVSQYLFRGTRLGGPALQPSAEYAAGGLGLGAWANIPLKNEPSAQSDPEIDCYGYYSIPAGNDLIVAPGFTLYTYPNAKERNGQYRATFEPSVAFSRAFGPFQFTPKIYYNTTLKGFAAELGVGFAVPLKALGTELDFTGTCGTFKWTDASATGGATTKNWGDYVLIGAAVPLQISVRSRVTLGWSYGKGSGNYLKTGRAGKVPNPAAAGRGIVSLSYAYAF